MFEHDEVSMSAFDGELEKLAVGALLKSLGQRALASGGAGALGATAGAGLGGVAGGVQGYRKSKQQGGSGLAGALGGAVRGAAIGGGAGLAAGGLAGAAGGARAQKLVRGLSGREDVVGKVSRLGERQAHSVTGALPAGMGRREGLRSMGAGVTDLEKRVTDVGKRLAAKPGDAKLLKQQKSLGKALEHGRKAEDLGMTSVPGMFKAMATKPGEALKAGLGQQWHGSPSVAGKAMTFGLPAAFVGSEAARKSKPGEDSRFTRTLKTTAETVPYMLGPMGILGATGLSMGGGAAARQAGRLVSKPKRLGTNPSAPVPEDASVSGNVERIYSPGAQGRPPEGTT